MFNHHPHPHLSFRWVICSLSLLLYVLQFSYVALILSNTYIIQIFSALFYLFIFLSSIIYLLSCYLSFNYSYNYLHLFLTFSSFLPSFLSFYYLKTRHSFPFYLDTPFSTSLLIIVISSFHSVFFIELFSYFCRRGSCLMIFNCKLIWLLMIWHSFQLKKAIISAQLLYLIEL